MRLIGEGGMGAAGERIVQLYQTSGQPEKAAEWLEKTADLAKRKP